MRRAKRGSPRTLLQFVVCVFFSHYVFCAVHFFAYKFGLKIVRCEHFIKILSAVSSTNFGSIIFIFASCCVVGTCDMLWVFIRSGSYYFLFTIMVSVDIRNSSTHVYQSCLPCYGFSSGNSCKTLTCCSGLMLAKTLNSRPFEILWVFLQLIPAPVNGRRKYAWLTLSRGDQPRYFDLTKLRKVGISQFSEVTSVMIITGISGVPSHLPPRRVVERPFESAVWQYVYPGWKHPGPTSHHYPTPLL